MLAGKRILIVEDEPLVAMAIEDMLSELGAEVVGPAGSVAEAFEALSGRPIDAAILDINLGSERSTGIGTIFVRPGRRSFSQLATAGLIQPIVATSQSWKSHAGSKPS